MQVAYEYGYTGDGVRVWKRDYLNQQEYRYLCRIGCGGVPMQVYRNARLLPSGAPLTRRRQVRTGRPRQ